MRPVSFGGVDLSTLSNEATLEVEGRSALVELSEGAYDQDGQDLYLKASRLSWTVDILDEDDLAQTDAKVDELLSVVGLGRRILKVVLYDGVTYRQTWAKITRLSRPRVQGQLYQSLQVEFLLDYPYWLDSRDEPHYLDQGEFLDAGLLLDSGHHTDLAVTSVPTTLRINNTGTARCRRGLILIKPAAASSIKNLKLTNRSTGESLQFLGTLGAGVELEIDLLPKSIKQDNVPAYNSLVLGPNQMDWMTLLVGDNNLVVTGDAITGTINISWYWSRHYV